MKLDFYKVETRPGKAKGVLEVYPEFVVKKSRDMMVRGGKFYAAWDAEAGLWSTDEYVIQRAIDNDISEKVEELKNGLGGDVRLTPKYSSNYSSRTWKEFLLYVSDSPDNFHQLDEKLTFSNTKVRKTDYVSKKLPYALEEGDYGSWDELVGTLYDPSEREKLEWAIGAIVAGEAKDIQKFCVLYGDAGAGKSTILNVIQKLFAGYYAVFEAKSLVTGNNQFALEVFKSNPLVAIQHDGDLSRIEDNTKLNSIVSHEEMSMNEKFKSPYAMRMNAFLFMATNRPVKITDAKSGIIRRLIDIRPSGRRIEPVRYHRLMSQIEFELGAIASHCLDVFKELGKNYYNAYRPLDMILKTDVFFNFVEDSYEVFERQNGTTLRAAYAMYKEYAEDSGLEGTRLPKYKFREELKNYFKNFYEITRVDGKQVRSYYEDFDISKFERGERNVEPVKLVPLGNTGWIDMNCTESLLDSLLADCPAQYATAEASEKPLAPWSRVTTKLSDIQTDKVHYVRVPKNHIVIDFDLKDESGAKSASLNAEAASLWPPTYAEFSKGGSGIHLHYIYDGNVDELASVYDEGIEIKVFRGRSSLRRRLSRCNDIPVATISSSSGLPRKEVRMVNKESVKSERSLRDLITRNLKKEIHPGTKPSIDFIKKILDDAYAGDLHYDVSDMRPAVLAFANNSSHHGEYCVKQVGEMKFKSDEPSEAVDIYDNDHIVFFDVEVFPNLFLVNWKIEGEGKKVVRMINPTPSDMESFMKMKLVGFNCRRYDNHIIYARYLGYSNQQLYELSQRIINSDKSDRGLLFGEAYNLSYTDIWDYASNKQSLKKWEIELGIHHQELGLPWDQPVPEDKWDEVAEYCDNDVIATEAVWNATQGDWTARKILADISRILTGQGSVNDTTNQLTARIILRGDKDAYKQFVYPDLSKEFPGYEFNPKKIDPSRYTGKIVSGYSIYRGEDPGEGGRVYSEPGMYFGRIKVFDVSSMHPHSIKAENGFGKDTQNFIDLIDIRLAIKNKDFEAAGKFFDGKLKPYLTNHEQAKQLSQALKIAINSVYGLTSAKFQNPFKDPRNIDNWVAKRGALFMIDLQKNVQERGGKVIHVKTDSIKVVNPTEEITNYIYEQGEKFGYTFVVEDEYDRICLVNQSVYVARHLDGTWTATGAEFQHPYVFKKLFSGEEIEFRDLCETKTVTSALYLDMNENLPNVEELEKARAKLVKEGSMPEAVARLDEQIAKGHNYIFIGKAGLFCPVRQGCGGGKLMREKDGKYYAATGTSDYRWLEAETVQAMNRQDQIDLGYFDGLVDSAIKHIEEYGDFDKFVND